MVPTVSSLLIPVSSSRPFSRNGASPQSFNRGDQFLIRFNFSKYVLCEAMKRFLHLSVAVLNGQKCENAQASMFQILF